MEFSGLMIAFEHFTIKNGKNLELFFSMIEFKAVGCVELGGFSHLLYGSGLGSKT